MPDRHLDKPLAGKKIAVLVENKFIPEEIGAYMTGFTLLGAVVEFFSRIWYGDYKPGNPNWHVPVFYSDVDPSDDEPWQSPQKLNVPGTNDVSVLADKLGDYAAVIMSANYTSVRLRWADEPNQPAINVRDYVQSAPVPRFFADAMKNKKVVKGALCHGLWILTPYPDALKGRKVTCHTVVMADILNCGADVQYVTVNGKAAIAPVVVDNDLVTGYSKHEVLPFIEAIAGQISILNS